MNYLIIVAHGSRRAESNHEVVTLAERLSPQLTSCYQQVFAAFQEIAQPSIEQMVAKAVELGATHIDLYPYFLVAGKHVSYDLPALLTEVQQAYPAIQIQLLPYLGQQTGLDSFICNALINPQQTDDK